MSFVNEKTEAGKCRTVDQERKIILQVCRSHPEYGYDFEMSIEDETLKFSAFYTDKVFGTPKLGETSQIDIKWNIYRIFYPKISQYDKQEILEIIKEALNTRGWNCVKEMTHSVTVEFDPHLS